MNLLSEIPENIEQVLLNDTYFSNVIFIKSYSSNINPNPITKVYVAIELESINVKNLSTPLYLGNSNDDSYFGNYSDVVVTLDIYSPKGIGGDGCYNTFFKIYEVLSNDSTYHISNASFGKISYDDDTFCFKSSCKLNINLFMAQPDSSLNT